MSTLRSRLRRLLLPFLVTAGMASGLILGSAPNAFADYGQGAKYQVEISDNCNGLQSCTAAQGDGIWLWVELNADGTGNYQGADCAHLFPTPNGLTSGAFHDSGNVTWTESGGVITIKGVTIIGGTVRLTITVPSAYGHYQKTAAQVFYGFPFPGMAQLQVAP